MWEQLANDKLACSLIADGFHLPDSVLKTVIGVKGNQAFLVSDATSLAGLTPGDYETHVGGKVTLTESGKLHLSVQPSVVSWFCTEAYDIVLSIWRTLKSLVWPMPGDGPLPSRHR